MDYSGQERQQKVERDENNNFTAASFKSDMEHQRLDKIV